MSKELKKIEDEKLEKVDGGSGTSLRGQKQDLRGMIPDAVQEKLKTAKNEKDANRILAENGINIEELKNKIAVKKIDPTLLGKRLPDDKLSDINGGFQNWLDQEVHCPVCGNTNEEDFTYQFWITQLIYLYDYSQFYKCDVCQSYIATCKHGNGHTYCTPVDEDWIDQMLIDSLW